MISKDLKPTDKMATRKRTETACVKCKSKKARCSDYRPCHRCLDSDPSECEDFSAVANRSLSTIRSILTGSSSSSAPAVPVSASVPDFNEIWQRLPFHSAEKARGAIRRPIRSLARDPPKVLQCVYAKIGNSRLCLLFGFETYRFLSLAYITYDS
jgi:hypothetical protein